MVHIDVENDSVWSAAEAEHVKTSSPAGAAISEAGTSSEAADMEVDSSSQDAAEAEASESDPSSSFNRTQSQEQRQIQVHAIVQRLEGHQEALRQLKETASLLVAGIAQEKVPSQDVKKMLQECRKTARNIEEDLLEDTLALDKLAGLFPQDRTARKSAISRLDDLLEDVDKVKSDLAAAEKDWNAKLEDAEQRVTAEAMEIHDTVVEESQEDTPIEPESPSTFQRTDSQVQKQSQVQDVMQRSTNRAASIQCLKEKFARLVARLSQEGACLEEEKKVLEDCRKDARNRSEDLLEDMVALDKLSGLFAEDRCKRKEMIARLDAFLQEVDEVKSNLAGLQKDLHAKVESQNAAKQKAAHALKEKVLRLQGGSGTQSRQPCTNQPSNPLPSHQCQGCGQESTEGREGDSGFEGQWFCSKCWQSWAGSDADSCSDPDPSLARAVQEVPVPTSDFWDQLGLSIQLRSSEERACYTLLAHPCKLCAQEVNLQLSPDASRLTISGTHLPSTTDLSEMKDTIAAHLARLGKKSCDSQAAQQLYAKLGSGSFGRFSKSFELPRDVDATRIEASCDEGVLCVRLPKRLRQAIPARRHPLLGGSPLLW